MAKKGKKRGNPEFKLHSGCVKWLRETHPNALTVHAGSILKQSAENHQQKKYQKLKTKKKTSDASGGGPWKGLFCSFVFVFWGNKFLSSEHAKIPGIHEGHSRPPHLPTKPSSDCRRIQDGGVCPFYIFSYPRLVIKTLFFLSPVPETDKRASVSPRKTRTRTRL